MWSFLKSSMSCSEKEELKQNQKHFEKLMCIKPSINNKGLEIPYFLKNKSYLRELKRERERNINIINNMMENKLREVAKSPSKYSKEIITPKYCPAFDKQRFNFSTLERRRIILSENKSMYKRLNERKPVYSTKNLLKKSDFEKYIRNNISKKRFLPKVGLKMCTFREFKSNLLRETRRLNENSNYLNDLNLSENIYKPYISSKQNKINNQLCFSFNNNNYLSDRDSASYKTPKSNNQIIKNMKKVKDIRIKIII